MSVPSPCISDERGFLTEIQGERRVKNVAIGGEDIDPDMIYKVAGMKYVILEQGDGLTAFDGCTVIQNRVKLDNQVLIEYITGRLGGEIGTEYSDPYGSGRIIILEKAE